MKTWKKAGTFICIAVFSQLMVLIYLNNHMLSSINVFKSEEIKAEEDIKILIPDNIEELKASYDGRYCSYYNDDSLYIIDTQTGMRKKMEFRDGEKLNSYKWDDNSNKIILAEQTHSNGAGRLKITGYDAVLGKKEDIKDLSWLGNNIKVDDFDLASENDLVVKVTHIDGRSDLYYVGSDVSKLSTVSRNIGFARYTGKDRDVLYWDNITKRHYVTGVKKPLQLKSPDSKVVGLDSNGNIYVFEEDEEGKKYIYFKELFTENNQWSSLELQQDIELKNIFIRGDGSVFVDLSLEGKFTEVKSKVAINYKGRFMAFFKDGIYTYKNDILEKIEFKDFSIN